MNMQAYTLKVTCRCGWIQKIHLKSFSPNTLSILNDKKSWFSGNFVFASGIFLVIIRIAFETVFQNSLDC